MGTVAITDVLCTMLVSVCMNVLHTERSCISTCYPTPATPPHHTHLLQQLLLRVAEAHEGKVVVATMDGAAREETNHPAQRCVDHHLGVGVVTLARLQSGASIARHCRGGSSPRCRTIVASPLSHGNVMQQTAATIAFGPGVAVTVMDGEHSIRHPPVPLPCTGN